MTLRVGSVAARPRILELTRVVVALVVVCSVLVGCGDSVEVVEAPAVPFTAVAVGESHGCALRVDGTVACWGDNEYGQAEAPGGVFTVVAAAGDRSCGLRSDGTVACWGLYVEAPDGAFAAVAVGAESSCGLRPDGSLLCWLGVVDDAGTVDAWTVDGGPFSAVSVGASQFCALGVDGVLACRGAAVPALRSPPEGTYRAVSAGAGVSCGVFDGGRVV